MAKKKTALISGITGQDGSYLADFLVKKGYRVFGLERRNSSRHRDNIIHLLEPKAKITLISGDLLDEASLVHALREARPQEVYNMASQSFVPESWEQPVYTGEVTGLGALRMLEAIRQVNPKIKFYQASSSEMFGAAVSEPQNERTQFYPRSPYAAAKVYAHWITVNYRESYDLFAVSGICFNHECVTAQTPVIVKQGEMIDIVAIEELVPHREDPGSGTMYTTIGHSSLEVWDGDHWTRIRARTATWNQAGGARDKKVKQVISRGGYYEATHDHISFLEPGKEVKTGDLAKGDRLALRSFPELTGKTILSFEEAEFIGMMVADGYVSRDGKGRFINNDETLRKRVMELWQKIAGGYSRAGTHPSGFNNKRPVHSIDLTGNAAYLRLMHSEIYNQKLFKKIPRRILNAKGEAVYAFLRGYNACDGLKGGHQKTEFKSFTTNSPVLALGLWYTVNRFLKLRITNHPEMRDGKIYFHLNINSNRVSPKSRGMTGHHLQRIISEVKEVREYDYTGWLFDLETESGTFSAGVGQTWIHNSPRRGLEFVTRKISSTAAKIKLGLAGELRLGNIDTKRDWGFAGDYVRAMWLMLQQKAPKDYVIATGHAHSVREFLKEAFSYLGLDWQKYVKIDKRFLRPAEVYHLRGDAARVRRELGWKPKVGFRELVHMMVDADLKRYGSKN